jgi:hypothetical protein
MSLLQLQLQKMCLGLELYVDWGDYVSSWRWTNRAFSQKDIEVVIHHFTSFARLSLQFMLPNYLSKVLYFIQELTPSYRS